MSTPDNQPPLEPETTENQDHDKAKKPVLTSRVVGSSPLVYGVPICTSGGVYLPEKP